MDEWNSLKLELETEMTAIRQKSGEIVEMQSSESALELSLIWLDQP